jgi:hypothetical protein
MPRDQTREHHGNPESLDVISTVPGCLLHSGLHRGPVDRGRGSQGAGRKVTRNLKSVTSSVLSQARTLAVLQPGFSR